MYKNSDTKRVKIGNTVIGGGEKIAIQSMLNVISADIAGNVAQAERLAQAGCEIIRVSVPDKAAAKIIPAIKEKIDIPIVADIHFDYKLALESIDAGADKIRINPGNIGDEANIKKVADACSLHNIPIRIGVNSGSLEKHILEKYGSPTAEAIVESGMYHVGLLNKFDFDNIVLSLKTSDTKKTYDAYVLASERCNYPLHLGITEAGTENMGIIKSAAGIGGLLLRGIGDTLRISLTDDPVKEVTAAKNLLKALGLRNGGIKFVSCPTCGRTKIDLISIAKAAEERFAGVQKNITVAIMGCVVNGPGEAKEADIGIAGGDGCAVLFKKDGSMKKIPEAKILDELALEIDKF